MDAPEIEKKSFIKPNISNQCHYLRLKLNDAIILIALNQITMVLPILELQPVPHQDPALEGILNYHGQPTPVYHLCVLVNEPKAQYDLNTPLVISNLTNGLVGFLVNEVIDIIELANHEIKHDHLNKTMPYVTGLLENEQWSAFVLDLEKLLQFHQSTLEALHA